ncbi:MAG TPA: DUF4038 domain-containing protein [Verrucomicrobiae bacterium]
MLFRHSAGQAFLYHADTGWQIFSQLTTEEALEYLTFRKEQGFNTIQVQIAMAPEQTNRYGHLPFEGNVDFSRPDEAYHEHVLELIRKTESMQLLVVTEVRLGQKPVLDNGRGQRPQGRPGVLVRAF